tara:strand:- start:605 stop:1327 length:723 start_codon:yes stop_codon:yes gene_type:complete
MKKFLFFLLFFSILNKPFLKAEELRSNILVLVDLSTSYFNPEFMKRLDTTLGYVNKTILTGVTYLPLNMMIQFLPIKEQSIISDTICEVEFAKRNLAGRQLGSGISKKKELKLFLDDCKKLILEQKEGKATDITGAIRKAVLIANSQLPQGEPRIVIILSDFEEDRALIYKKEKELSFKDFSFALIYPGQLVEDKKSGEAKEVLNYAEALKSRLLKQGADKVGLYISGADFSKKIRRDLF